VEQQQARRIAIEGLIVGDHPGVDGVGAAQVEMDRRQLAVHVQGKELAAEIRLGGGEQVARQGQRPAGGEHVGLAGGDELRALQLEQSLEGVAVGGERREHDRRRLALSLAALLLQVLDHMHAGGAALGGIGLITFAKVGDPGLVGPLSVWSKGRLALQHPAEIKPVHAQRRGQCPGVEVSARLGQHRLVVTHGRARGHGGHRPGAQGHEPPRPTGLGQHGDPQTLVGAALRPLDRQRPQRRQEGRIPRRFAPLQRTPLGDHVRGHVVWPKDLDVQARVAFDAVHDPK